MPLATPTRRQRVWLGLSTGLGWLVSGAFYSFWAVVVVVRVLWVLFGYDTRPVGEAAWSTDRRFSVQALTSDGMLSMTSGYWILTDHHGTPSLFTGREPRLFDYSSSTNPITRTWTASNAYSVRYQTCYAPHRPIQPTTEVWHGIRISVRCGSEETETAP